MTVDHGSDQRGTGFADLLRARRATAGMTQADLASAAGIGVRTVRDLERGRASRPQRTTVELIATALALSGRERAEFLAAARGRLPVPGQPVPPRNGLPPPVELIGRDTEVADVAELLTSSGPPGVVTLVGLAGVGKTSLGLAVAERIAADHPGGTAGTVITELSSGSDVLAQLAAVLGVARAADLRARLRGEWTFVMIDGVERAPDAVAEALHWLIESGPNLRVLATGRHPIGLPGEHVWPVGPLETPPADAPARPDEIAAYPAAALFLARLRQVRRDPITDEEAVALGPLLRRLGGLPLALELAAARGRLLDIDEILQRYGDRVLDLSGRPGSRPSVDVTLRDAAAASYRLLEPGERAGLRRLAAFRNRWSVRLAAAILSDDDAEPVDPLPLLDRLLELGLLGVRGAGPFRFRLVDVVRDLAEERAVARGEASAIRTRHAAVLARLAERTAPQLAGHDLTGGVNRLDEVSGDLWAALAHAANDDPHTALRIAAALPRWWRFRGRDVVGRHWLRRLLADPRTEDADSRVRAWAQIGLGRLALEHGAGAEELPAVTGALTEFQRRGEVAGELAARNLLCALWMTNGGYDEARRHGEAALTLATRLDRPRDITVAQNNLTWHEIRSGDLRAARRRLAAVDRLAAQQGDDRLRALAMANLAEVNRLGGRFAEAQSLGRRAVEVLERHGDPGHRRRLLGTIGIAAAQAGDAETAGRILAELREPAGVPDDPDERRPAVTEGQIAMIEAYLASGRGERELAAEWFTVAADSHAGGHDLRDVAEALVGLAASMEDPQQRASVLARLAEVCKLGGITLLPGERERSGAG
ncbi:putative ATPase/transcriptional regulator with XRE-family HTH domain [Catenuloplanes nepalensis]|uniref:ATPase/transcriptional regulator with XRE-family HTH domain n=1 Tax=Catenuloplanes nepalensis TaxID=587533 RepID=A0ABT9N427_9ACTN|nr:helix-turn-helix domain-containing protein [Catenuloplanes nepalensis]MDP9798462.1 putative ATPase/transcriptional regulator with XRE-family HTH domain [Catenuloplanes nepalensis]